jgi:hypothetical protein
VVHIGFEALGADAIERRRYEKIMDTTRKFDRGRTQLQYIYCHYFAPEASPEETWAIDETVQWLGIHPDRRPPKAGHLLPSDSTGRSGVGESLAFLARGRDYRSEFHINPSDEVMLMIKGDMRLHFRTPEGKEEIAVVPEGRPFTCPPEHRTRRAFRRMPICW